MSGKNTLTFTFLQELDEKIGTALMSKYEATASGCLA